MFFLFGVLKTFGRYDHRGNSIGDHVSRVLVDYYDTYVVQNDTYDNIGRVVPKMEKKAKPIFISRILM